jgi:hypothetical protein
MSEPHLAPLRVQDVCEISGFSRWTVEQEMRNGNLTAKKVCGRWVTHKANVDAWLFGSKADAKEPAVEPQALMPEPVPEPATLEAKPKRVLVP